MNQQLPTPPITIDEGGDIQVYPSVASACSDLESIDVLEGIYCAFDSRGNILQIHTSGHHVTGMSLIPGEFPDPDGLSRRLRSFIAVVGPDLVGLVDYEHAPLPALLDALLDFARRG